MVNQFNRMIKPRTESERGGDEKGEAHVWID